MKIVKVIHANTNTEFEKEYFSLKNYDADSFFLRKKTEILENSKKHHKQLLGENKSSHAVDLPNSLTALLNIPMTTLLNTSIKLDNSNRERYEKIQQILFANLVIKNTTIKLLQDITDQLKEIESISLEKARIKYPKTRNLSVGTYTLHPRNSLRLTRLEHYHKNLALEKDDELIILLGQMGAKSLRIIEADNKKSSGSIEAEYNKILLNLKGNIDLSKEIEKGKDLFVRFEGNVVDIDPNLLNNSLWFSDDSRLLSIFKSRRFNKNKIEEYTLRNTYTETFDFDFSLAAKFLVFQIDLKTEYQMISKKERLFHVEFGR